MRRWRAAHSRSPDRTAGTGAQRQPRDSGPLVSPWAVRLADAAARVLPAAGRARYREEFRYELQEIAGAGQPRRQQMGCALRQLRSALPMRAELAAPRRHGQARLVAAAAAAVFVAGAGGFALKSLPQAISPASSSSAAGSAQPGSASHPYIDGALIAMNPGLAAQQCPGDEATRAGHPAPANPVCSVTTASGAASLEHAPASHGPAPAASPSGAPSRPRVAP